LRALAVSDLTILDGSPCIRETRLSEALGIRPEWDISQLIQENFGELMRRGPAWRTTTPVWNDDGQKHAADEYYLNEQQALLICILSGTENAALTRQQMSEVFLAWRRTKLVDTVRADATTETLQRLEGRLAALERTGQQLSRLQTEPTDAALALAHAVSLWFDQERASRPKFWGDVEVRGLMLSAHRQMTVDEAKDKCVLAYGIERSPSRSAIHRFWLRLDRLKLAADASSHS
jgi:hypothetical protein